MTHDWPRDVGRVNMLLTRSRDLVSRFSPASFPSTARRLVFPSLRFISPHTGGRGSLVLSRGGRIDLYPLPRIGNGGDAVVVLFFKTTITHPL